MHRKAFIRIHFIIIAYFRHIGKGFHRNFSWQQLKMRSRTPTAVLCDTRRLFCGHILFEGFCRKNSILPQPVHSYMVICSTCVIRRFASRSNGCLVSLGTGKVAFISAPQRKHCNALFIRQRILRCGGEFRLRPAHG